MNLTEQHIVNPSHVNFAEINNLTFLSKNLYNSGLYVVRQFYITNKKYLNYNDINRQFVKEKQMDYYKLPAKVSQQTLKMVDQNFKSFFELIKINKQKSKIPNYLKKDGKFILTYTNQAISFKRKGYIKLSGTNIYIKTDITKVNCVRIVPGNRKFTIEIVYEKLEKKLRLDNNRYCGIDTGVNNLALLGSNVIKPILINGRPLKSINQYYNKEKSKIQSNLEKNKIKSSKKLINLTNKRNNKINDYLHKSSRYIVNYLVSNDINSLIVGYNKNWKQDINIGKRNNQNFVGIPHCKFLNMLEYKCKLEGINFIKTEESYTSKCSFMDNESLNKKDVYLGERIKRGLFRSSNGYINADLNGSLNIIKKVVGEYQYPIEVCSTPKVITLKY